MTPALLNEASPAALSKQEAIRDALMATRRRLADDYEDEALRELKAVVQEADEHVKARLALAYAENPEDWSYAKMLATRRLETLQAQLDAEIAYLNNGARDITSRYASYAFIRDAEKAHGALAAMGLGVGGALVDMNVVNFYVNYPLGGVIFGERFAAMTAAMQYEARKAIIGGLTAGDGLRDITRAVTKVTDLNRAAAASVVRTTVMNASNQAHAYVYEKAGVDEVVLDETLDARTCAVCIARDQSRIKLKDAAGVLAHPNCRVVLVPVVDGMELGPRRGKAYDEKGRVKSKVFAGDVDGMDYLKSLPREQRIQVLGVNRVRLVDDGYLNYDDLWNRDGELILLRDLDVPDDYEWVGGKPQ